MSLPTPRYPLDDICTEIFNNTLYTYSSAAFQSLKLERGAQWEVLPMGVPVSGGSCVKTTPVNNTDASALWIVGGRTNETEYEGLQRYSFTKGTWETVIASDPVAQNRLYHNAAYLNASDSILLFAGTQDLTRTASSHTFTIKATEPFEVTAYQANIPPAISPMVMAMTQSKALYVGGSETNTQMMVFSPSKSWQNTNATLATPFYNTTNIKAILQNGNDGSKTLMTFDMTVLPNSVNRTIFIDAEGNPVVNATPIVEVQPNDKAPITHRTLNRRGNLTVENWPEYNDTLAPSTTRTVYSVARDQSGMIVISGGNHDDVLCIFKARSNTWINATEKLSVKSAQVGLGLEQAPEQSPSPSSTTTSLPSSTETSTMAAIPTVGGSNSNIGKILGGVLGSLAGVALILLALLFLLRWKKKRREFIEAGHQRRSSGIPNNEKRDFVDMGLPHMSSTRQFGGHEQQNSVGSMSSMAILLGRAGHKRGDKDNGSQVSNSSSQFSKDYKAAIGKPKPINGEQAFRTLADPIGDEKPVIVEERSSAWRTRGASRREPCSTRRSSGWNKYWSGGAALNIFGFGRRESNRSSGSQYSDDQVQSRVTQMSASVPPLAIGNRPEVQRVVSGSPTIRGGDNFPFTQEMKGRIERPGSVSTLSSYNEDDRRDAFSSGVPASVADDHNQQNYWTPIDGSTYRASSNVYSESNYTTTTQGRETMFSRATTTQQPSAPASQPSDMSWLNLGQQRGI